MKSLRLFLALALLASAARQAHSDDPLGSIGSLGSKSGTGQVLADVGKMQTPAPPGAFAIRSLAR